MKKLVSIIIFCLFCFSGLTAQNYWKRIEHTGILLGATADGTLFYYEGPSGIGRSFDEGDSCPIVLGPETGFNHLFSHCCFSVSPEGRVFVFCTSLNTVMYSDDNGDTWQQMSCVSSCATTDVAGLYATNNETVVGWSSNGEIFWTTDNGVTWDGAIPGFMFADNAPTIGDLLVKENGDVYIGISTIDIYEGGGIYHLMLSDMQEGERVAGVGVNICDMAFDPEGNVVACGYSGDGSSVGFQHIPGFYLFDGTSLAISDSGIVYRPSYSDDSAVLSYSLDHGEHFTHIGEDIPIGDMAPGGEADRIMKGYDNYLYFGGDKKYWKSIANADNIPTYYPLTGLKFFDEASGLYYIITSETSVEVTYDVNHFNTYIGDIIIPEAVTYEGVSYTVTAIGNEAFQNCEGDLTSVVVPNTVTSIGEKAFVSCPNLRVVSLPDSVDTIGVMTFAGCTRLTTVRMPRGITVLPHEMFDGCSSLISFEIPPTVTRIGLGVFRGTGLTAIEIPESVTAIGANAFNACKFDSLYIPNTVMEIGAGAFSSCSSLQSIHLPDSLSIIPSQLFEGCWSLTEIIIPSSVTAIGEAAFSACIGLVDIVVPEGVLAIGDNAFSACWQLNTIVLPETLTTIGNYAFFNCENLRTVNLPQGLITIPRALFNSCVNLESIVIPESVTSIQGWAFTDCESLKAIVIPNHVESIGVSAFYGCMSLSRIELGNSVSFLGEQALMTESDTTKLTIVCHGTIPPQCGYTTFPGVELQEKAIVPCGCEDIYREAWGEIWRGGFEEDCGTDNNEWYYEIINDDGSITYQYLQQTNDTTINDKDDVHVLVRINTLYDKGAHVEKSHEYIYDENDKVYWWNKDLQEFTVLYDFGAEAGEEWEIKVGLNSLVIHVDAVEQYEYEGRLYKMLQVSDAGNQFSGTIVRGIGHLTSYFPERLMNSRKGYRVEGIRCFWKEELLMFKNGSVACDEVHELHNYAVEAPSEMDKVKVYPNPTDGVITVSGCRTGEYRITNMLGQTLMNGCIDDELRQIDVALLSPGVYFINIDRKTTKFVKY